QETPGKSFIDLDLREALLATMQTRDHAGISGLIRWRGAMRHIAIIGSGPAGYYTAEAAQKAFAEDVRVDVFDCLPVPYGLIRTGVAPDHQSIKGVSRRFEQTALN